MSYDYNQSWFGSGPVLYYMYQYDRIWVCGAYQGAWTADITYGYSNPRTSLSYNYGGCGPQTDMAADWIQDSSLGEPAFAVYHYLNY